MAASRRWVLAGLVALLAVVTIAASYHLGTLRAEDTSAVGDTTTGESVIGTPRVMTEEQLRAFATQAGTVYWAGPMGTFRYEVTQVADGSVFVRYLPESADVGDPRRDFLSVATYPVADGYDRLKAASDAEGATAQTTQSGALVVTYPGVDNGAYFSFEGANFQVEVYSPNKDEALELVNDGTIELVS